MSDRFEECFLKGAPSVLKECLLEMREFKHVMKVAFYSGFEAAHTDISKEVRNNLNSKEDGRILTLNLARMLIDAQIECKKAHMAMANAVKDMIRSDPQMYRKFEDMKKNEKPF